MLALDLKEEGSPIMEGLIAKKGESVGAVTDDESLDIDVVSIDTINERLGITLLNRLLLLVDDLDLSDPTTPSLQEHLVETKAALGLIPESITLTHSPSLSCRIARTTALRTNPCLAMGPGSCQ